MLFRVDELTKMSADDHSADPQSNPPSTSSRFSNLRMSKRGSQFSKLSDLLKGESLQLDVQQDAIDCGKSKFLFFIPSNQITSKRQSQFSALAEERCNQSQPARIKKNSRVANMRAARQSQAIQQSYFRRSTTTGLKKFQNKLSKTEESEWRLPNVSKQSEDKPRQSEASSSSNFFKSLHLRTDNSDFIRKREEPQRLTSPKQSPKKVTPSLSPKNPSPKHKMPTSSSSRKGRKEQITPTKETQLLCSLDELDKVKVRKILSGQSLKRQKIEITIKQQPQAEKDQKQQIIPIQPQKPIDTPRQPNLISPYDDLYLSTDLRQMSSMGYLPDQGTYLPSMTSFQSLAAFQLEKDDDKQILEERIMQLQNQITHYEDMKQSMISQVKKQDDSNFLILKSQLVEMQNVLQRLVRSTIGDIRQQKVECKGAECQRAGILKFAHVDQQLTNLFQKQKKILNDDFNFETDETIGLFASQLPGKPTLFGPQLQKVQGSRLATVLNILSSCSPQLITRLFEKVDVSEGIVFIWLYLDGQFNPVFIDQKLPFNRETLEPRSIQPCSNQNWQLWPMFIEKAIAKSLGSYDKIAQQSYQTLFLMLTGLPPHTLNLLPSRCQQLHKPIILAIDNGHFIFGQADHQDDIIFIQNYKDNKFQIKRQGRKQFSTLSEMSVFLSKLYIINCDTMFHQNYTNFQIPTTRTMTTEIALKQKVNLYLSIWAGNNNNVSMCIYKVEEDMLKLVAEKTQVSPWLQLILKKGQYKLFVSCQPLRLTEVDFNKSGQATSRTNQPTDRSMHTLPAVLTISSKENIRCCDDFSILRKEGQSKVGNGQVSYQAVRMPQKKLKSMKEKAIPVRRKVNFLTRRKTVEPEKPK